MWLMLGVAVCGGGVPLVRHGGTNVAVWETPHWTEDVGDGVRNDVDGQVLHAARSKPHPVLSAVSSLVSGHVG